MPRGNESLGEIATNVLFENDRVKIWNLIVEPGEASEWHLHERDYVTVVVEAGGLTAEYEDGTTEVNEYEVGRWGYRDQHQVHRVVNHTDRRYENVLIEIKG